MLRHRLAIVTACAAFLMIVAGGLVTSTGSGMADENYVRIDGFSGTKLYEHVLCNRFQMRTPWAKRSQCFARGGHKLTGASRTWPDAHHTGKRQLAPSLVLADTFAQRGLVSLDVQ